MERPKISTYPTLRKTKANRATPPFDALYITLHFQTVQSEKQELKDSYPAQLSLLLSVE